MILQRPILSNNSSIESVFFVPSNIQDVPTLWRLTASFPRIKICLRVQPMTVQIDRSKNANSHPQTAVRFKKRTEIKVCSTIISHGWTDSTVEMWISDIRWINRGFICRRLLSWDKKTGLNWNFQIRLKNISVHQFCQNPSNDFEILHLRLIW